MRLVHFIHRGQRRFGIAREESVVELPEADVIGVMRMLLEGKAPKISVAALYRQPHIPLDSVTFLPPILPGANSFWVGANYRTLLDNRTGGPPSGDYPSLFQRVPTSLVGHESAILRPRNSGQLDYEGEVVIVVGKGGRYIPEDQALDHVGCITVGLTSRPARISIAQPVWAPGS
jgi:2-keto-4-pentenoate hydratase/2-oxohepta-3-ene-1,7-dioic acid hydratase in catechol pathway